MGMESDERWQVGDVIVWFETSQAPEANTDSDVFLRFYDSQDQLICWAEAYERGDLQGFEVGELNCGYLGNLQKQAWLQRLLDDGVKLGIQTVGVTADNANWLLDRITVDFRLGPLASTPTVRNWQIQSWIKPGEAEQYFFCSSFVAPGFDKELEIQSGGPDELSDNQV
jgi:hypothetical protein